MLNRGCTGDLHGETGLGALAMIVDIPLAGHAVFGKTGLVRRQGYLIALTVPCVILYLLGASGARRLRSLWFCASS